MKIFKIIIVLFFVLYSEKAFSETNIVNEENFRYFSELSGVLKPEQVYRVILPPEVIMKSENNIEDLRIFDAKNNQVPYSLISEVIPEKNTTSYKTEVKAFTGEDKYSQVTLKLSENKIPKINNLVLETPNKDFKYPVKVFGSNNQQKWELLKNDTIYDFSSSIDLRKTDISFKESSFQFYRVQILDNKGENWDSSLLIKFGGLRIEFGNSLSKDLRVDAITAKFKINEKEKTVFDSYNFNAPEIKQDDKKNSIIIIEANLPFERMEFNVLDKYFSRNIEIYYSDEENSDDSYKLIYKGSIYNISLGDIQENKSFIEYLETEKHKYYKFIIHDMDNLPLKIKDIKLKWSRKNIYFMPSEITPPFIMTFGNKNVDHPSYDFNYAFNQSNWFNHEAKKISMKEIKTTKNFIEELSNDNTEKVQKNLLTGVVIFIVLLLGFWLFRMVSDTRKNPQ